MGAWRPKHVQKVCSNKICILLHHVGVLFNLIPRFLTHLPCINNLRERSYMFRRTLSHLQAGVPLKNSNQSVSWPHQNLRYWVPKVFLGGAEGQNGSGIELRTRLHTVSKTRMNGAEPPLLIRALMSSQRIFCTFF